MTELYVGGMNTFTNQKYFTGVELKKSRLKAIFAECTDTAPAVSAWIQIRPGVRSAFCNHRPRARVGMHRTKWLYRWICQPRAKARGVSHATQHRLHRCVEERRGGGASVYIRPILSTIDRLITAIQWMVLQAYLLIWNLSYIYGCHWMTHWKHQLHSL